MATVGTTAFTLAEWAKRLDPMGNIDTIVEIMNETNEVLDDMLWIEANGPTGHRTTRRAGLPSPTWRRLNEGVPNTKGKTEQVTDACGISEDYGEVDKVLADLNGNTAEFRLSEDKAHIEGMSQDMADNVFHGNTNTDPEKIMGLGPRYSSLTGAYSDNILNAAGSGSDNTSIYLVVWGSDTICGIFPKGSKAGLTNQDMGEQTLFDADGNKYQGYRSHYQWLAGVCVRDWRYCVRICNIDVSDLKKDASSGADLIDLLTQAVEIPPSLGGGAGKRASIYCNKTIKSFLRRQIVNKDNVNLTMDEIAGKKVVAFDGVPVRRNDKILNTESVVS